MPMLRFVLRDGAVQDLKADPGMSVMDVATGAGLRGIVADCGGECQCATCHVYVDEQFLPLLPAADEMEMDMLEGVAAPLEAGSRLSCQLIVEDRHDQMIIRIPPTQ